MTYHNPVNYARGLLDELEGAVRLARTEVVAAVRAELAAVFGELEAINPDALPADARGRLMDVRTRASAAMASESAEETVAEDGAKPTARATAGRKGAPRNADAASAPERAVLPAGK